MAKQVLVPVGIRRAEAGDFPKLAALVGCDPEDPALRLAEAGVFSYLAEDDECFGFVTVGPDLLSEETGEIINLFVSPAHRGQGMGMKLLVHGIGLLRRRQFESACQWLEIGSYAETLVRKLDFSPVTETRDINFQTSDSSFYTSHQQRFELDISHFY